MSHLHSTHVATGFTQQQLFAQLRLLNQFYEDLAQCSVNVICPGHVDQQLQGLLLSLRRGQVAGLIQLHKLLG